MDRAWRVLGRRRDRVVARLETGYAGDDCLERDVPGRGIVTAWSGSDIVPANELEDLAESEASLGDYFMVLLLISGKCLQVFLRVFVGGKLGDNTKYLTGCHSRDVDIVTEDGAICGRNREWYFGEGGIEGDDINNGITFVPESQYGQQAVDLNFGVGGPDADVVTMLVVDPGTFDLQFHVHAVTFVTVGEEFASNGDRRWVWVLGIVNTAGLGERSGRQFTEVDLFSRVGSVLRDHKVWCVATLALFYVESGGEFWPHLLFPLEVVLLHCFVVVAFTPRAHSVGAKLGELGIDLSGN